MDGLAMAALNGDASWITDRDAALSPFCSMLGRMHWGAAWHALSCALVDGELLGEFEPLLPDLFRGISSFEGGLFDCDVSFIWNELDSETNFMTADGPASKLALDRFLAILERRPHLSALVRKFSDEGIPDSLDQNQDSVLGFASDFIFALARSGPAAIARAEAASVLPSRGHEVDWLRALSMGEHLQSSAVCEKVFGRSPSDEPPEGIVVLPQERSSSKPRLEHWVASLVKANPPLAKIVFDWVGNDVIKASPGHDWLDADPLMDDGDAAKQAAVIATLWERKALSKRSIEAGLARNKRRGGGHPAVEAMMEAILIGGVAIAEPLADGKGMRL